MAGVHSAVAKGDLESCFEQLEHALAASPASVDWLDMRASARALAQSSPDAVDNACVHAWLPARVAAQARLARSACMPRELPTVCPGYGRHAWHDR